MTSPFKAMPKDGLFHAVFFFRKPPTPEFHDQLEQTFQDLAFSTFLQEQADGQNWKAEIILLKKADHADITARLALVEKLTGYECTDMSVEALPDRDWLKYVHESFPPVTVGPFFVFGSHWKETPPPGLLPLKIDAATAFGSGEHETTKGCLLALEHLKQKHPDLRSGLDMGCGSGILAIAMTKLWPVLRVLAVDIDPESIEVTRRHVQFNNAGGSIVAIAGDGYADPAVGKTGPFDLIVANILAGPLIEFSGDLARHLKNGGYCILSGLLKRQAADVLSAHAAHGLVMEREFPINDWQTLVLRKP